jgi:hypothetical protein
MRRKLSVPIGNFQAGCVGGGGLKEKKSALSWVSRRMEVKYREEERMMVRRIEGWSADNEWMGYGHRRMGGLGEKKEEA